MQRLVFLVLAACSGSTTFTTSQSEALCSSLCQKIVDCNLDPERVTECKKECTGNTSLFAPPMRSDWIDAYTQCMSRKTCSDATSMLATIGYSDYWKDDACRHSATAAVHPRDSIVTACTSCCAGKRADCTSACVESGTPWPDSIASCIRTHNDVCGVDDACRDMVSRQNGE